MYLPPNPSDNPKENVEEMGFSTKSLPRVGEDTLLPSMGGNVVPHYLTFQGIYNIASRTYRWSFDEALKASPQNALLMRNDLVIMSALQKRYTPTVRLNWHIEPRNPDNIKEQEAAKKVERAIKLTPHWQQLLWQLQEAIWYGRHGVALQFEYTYSNGERLFNIKRHDPVNGDKLFFKWGGRVGILVNATFPGEKEIVDRYGMCHFLTDEEREQFIIHKYRPEDADFNQSEFGGAINGVGVRSRIYWFWFLKQQVFAQLTTYLERCANGFTVYYFDAGNDESAKEIEKYVKTQQGQHAIIFPGYRNGVDGYRIQRVEPGTAGAQLLENLVTSYFDDLITRFILGHNLTADTSSSVAESHSEALSHLIKYDSTALAETLTEDLVKVMYRWNCPGVLAGKFVFDIDTPNSNQIVQNAMALYQMQIPIDADEMYKITGLSPPAKGDAMASNLGDLSPVAMGQTPEGIPVEGAPMPQPPQVTQQTQGNILTT